jgi:hypothetical protein
VFTATREIPQPAIEQLGSCKKRCLIARCKTEIGSGVPPSDRKSIRASERSLKATLKNERYSFSFVMRGLNPRIQGRGVRSIITEGAAWMPGSRPGMMSGGGSLPDSVIWARD